MQGRGSGSDRGRDFKTLARAQKGFRQCKREREEGRVGTGRRPVPDACAAANVASVDL